MTALPMPEDASEWEDLFQPVTLLKVVDPLTLGRLIAEIRETNRAREDMLRADNKLILQIKAIRRRLAAAAGDQLVNDTRVHVVPGAASSAEGDHPSCVTPLAPVSLADLSTMYLEESRAVLHSHRLTFERVQQDRKHTSELQSHSDLVCRLLLEKKKKKTYHLGHSN